MRLPFLVLIFKVSEIRFDEPFPVASIESYCVRIQVLDMIFLRVWDVEVLVHIFRVGLLTHELLKILIHLKNEIKTLRGIVRSLFFESALMTKKNVLDVRI
jgi:hypothetical protein